LHGAFVWARRALDRPKRRSPARAGNYNSSPHWDEWSETVPVDQLFKRQAQLTGGTGTRHIELEAEAQVAEEEARKQKQEELEAAPPVVETVEGAAEAEDFGGAVEDLEADGQLSDLAVSITKGVLEDGGFSQDRAGLRIFCPRPPGADKRP
jgi:hypothetical protein